MAVCCKYFALIPALTFLKIPDKENNFAKKQACRVWFSKANRIGLNGIRQEFNDNILMFLPNMFITAFNDAANVRKNRYYNVPLLDKTRVKIQINPENDDYIHASKIEIRPDLIYISAQGPLAGTASQFWLMCIQEEVKVILQLCPNVEDGKEKCSEYLPKGNEWTSYGPVKVKAIKHDTILNDFKRTLIQCKFGDKEITVSHIMYSGWADRDVPESASTFREIRTILHKLCEKKPIVVHCSAGIGRSGTFVAIELVCNKLLNECDGEFKMVDLMQELRRKRTQAIENDWQYLFVYRALIEILISEEGLTKSPEVSQFIQAYDDLIAYNKKQRIATL